MFEILLLVLLLLAGIHASRLNPRTTQRMGEVFLLYILVGYCGLPMLMVGTFVLVKPVLAARMLGFPAGGAFEEFAGLCLVAMSLLPLLALRYRGSFLIAPAVCWAVYFAGATVIHVKNLEHGRLTHGGLLDILATHGLIAIIIVCALLASGVLKEAARA